jgi:hypothetical protein
VTPERQAEVDAFKLALLDEQHDEALCAECRALEVVCQGTTVVPVCGKHEYARERIGLRNLRAWSR